MTDEDSEKLLLNTLTATEKKEHFLNILPNRGPEAYRRFIEALEQDDHDQYIIDILESTEVTQEEIFKYIGTSFAWFLSDLHYVICVPLLRSISPRYHQYVAEIDYEPKQDPSAVNFSYDNWLKSSLGC